MPSGSLEYSVKEKRRRRNSQELFESNEISNGKLVEMVQTCLRCGRTLSFKRTRKHCPYCQSTLRTRILILKAP